jgi:hypothetical protein
MLSAADCAAFRRDGFVLPGVAVGRVAVAALGAAVGAARSDATVAAALPACADDVRAAIARLIGPLIGADAVLAPGVVLPADAPAGWRAARATAPDGAVLVVRLALERADRTTGCLRLLPRPHERLVRALRNAPPGAAGRAGLVLAADAVDAAIAVAAVRDPGMLTLYDPDTLVCEPADRPGPRRAAVVFHGLRAS